MIEVFITNIKTKTQIEKTLNSMNNDFPNLKINFDLNDTKKTFPCGHTVLRVESNRINPVKIISQVKELGFTCEILENKIRPVLN